MVTLTLEGMSCHHCVVALERELARVAGLEVLAVEIGKAEVSWHDGYRDDNALRAAVERAGFRLTG